MPRTVSASEAKTRFGTIADWAAEAQDDVIVESHGQPKVVIISFEEYQRVVVLREEARRRQALERLRSLRDRVRARNQDLDEEGAVAWADDLTREVVREMIDEGKIRYQGR